MEGRADVRARAWMLAGVAGLAASVVYFVLSPTAQSILYAAMAGGCGVAVFVGVWLHRASVRWHWWLIGAGLLLMSVGDLMWTVVEEIRHEDMPFPSLADAAYLASYPVLMAGLLVLTRLRLPGRDVPSLLDAAVIAVGGGLAIWVFLIEPLADVEATASARAVSVAYPALDIALLAVAARLAFSGGNRREAFHLLLGVLCLLVVTDVVYGVMELQGTYGSGNWIDGGFLLTFVGWAMVGLHPSMRDVHRSPDERALRPRTVSARRVVLLGLASLTAPGVLTVQLVRGGELHLPVIIVTSALLFVLVVVRLGGLMRDLSTVAMHDSLTGLTNRGALVERLTRLVRNTQPGRLAVLFVDLDRFKRVNDSLGHHAGDRLLSEVALRLSRSVRATDTVARFGGDEFVIVAEVSGLAGAVELAERVLQRIQETVWLDDAPVFPCASVGVALASGSDDDAEVLIADADAAMFRAKSRGRACYEVFDGTRRATALNRLNVEAALHEALDNDELRVRFEPVVRIADRAIVGYEALVRWQLADGSELAPADFLTVAEETGLIVPIGERVLDEALAQLRRWNDESPEAAGSMSVSVNLSARQLAQVDLVEVVRAALERHSIDPSRLYLEVTEHALMPDEAIAVLDRLRRVGVGLAIDDFGTGFSSLERLRLVHFDVLKIDQSYVASLDDPKSRAIVHAVVAMGDALDIRVVAEGVETNEELDMLASLGCELVQGYLLGDGIMAVSSSWGGLSRTRAIEGSGHEHGVDRRDLGGFAGHGPQELVGARKTLATTRQRGERMPTGREDLERRPVGGDVDAERTDDAQLLEHDEVR
jgi:diguanylate cyclase (GGDEF)-like protein